MSTAEWVTLTVGMAAAGVALVGYLLSQAAGRRQHKTHLFAEALEAVKAFEELPFRIAKRPASDATTRAELSNKVSDLFVKLGFYRAWTQIESPLVGEAYVILLDKTHAAVGPLRKAAWERDLLQTDREAHIDGLFFVDNKPETALCLAVMQRELRADAILIRRGTKKMIAGFRTHRTHLPFSTRSPWFGTRSQDTTS
jgi:hypothetical protein